MNKFFKKLYTFLFGKSEATLERERIEQEIQNNIHINKIKKEKLNTKFRDIFNENGKVYTIYHKNSLLPLDHYANLNRLAQEFNLPKSTLYRGFKGTTKTYSIEEYTIVKTNE